MTKIKNSLDSQNTPFPVHPGDIDRSIGQIKELWARVNRQSCHRDARNRVKIETIGRFAEGLAQGDEDLQEGVRRVIQDFQDSKNTNVNDLFNVLCNKVPEIQGDIDTLYNEVRTEVDNRQRFD